MLSWDCFFLTLTVFLATLQTQNHHFLFNTRSHRPNSVSPLHALAHFVLSCSSMKQKSGLSLGLSGHFGCWCIHNTHTHCIHFYILVNKLKAKKMMADIDRHTIKSNTIFLWHFCLLIDGWNFFWYLFFCFPLLLRRAFKCISIMQKCKFTFTILNRKVNKKH